MFFLFPSELTVRTEPSGGDLAPQVICGSALGLAGRSRVILLCHGYANSVGVARESYGKFLANFILQFPMAKPMKTDVFEFYWPGDEPYPGVSQLSYPFQVNNARDSAQRLAKYLENLPAPATGEIERYLIAHSLGNRVALELLKGLSSGGGEAQPAWNSDDGCRGASGESLGGRRASPTCALDDTSICSPFDIGLGVEVRVSSG